MAKLLPLIRPELSSDPWCWSNHVVNIELRLATTTSASWRRVTDVGDLRVARTARWNISGNELVKLLLGEPFVGKGLHATCVVA
jgi:hypothetical protein